MFLILSFSLQANASLHIVVDPGHGGNDGGATFDGLKESTLVLQISKKLRDIIAADPDFKVTMTRERNKFVTLKQRAAHAEKIKADIFLSIHANSSSDRRAQGKEIYFQNQLPPDEEALFLAKYENKHSFLEEKKAESSDVNAIIGDLKRNHRIYMSGKLSEFLAQNWLAPGAKRKRPIRQAPFHVISNVSMPSVLIETGYVTHRKEAVRLQNPAHQEKIARGIYLGLKEFKEFMDRETKPHLN